MKSIESLRREIDIADDELLGILSARTALAEEIIELKHSLDKGPVDVSREREIISRAAGKFGPELGAEFIEKLYKLIFYRSTVKVIPEYKSIGEALSEKPFVISGPCSVESRENTFEIAEKVRKTGISILRGGAFKPRTNPDSFQGIGFDGYRFLREAADKFGMFTCSEIMDESIADEAAGFIDFIQIGSRNMASYSLLKKIGKISAVQNKPVLLKRGYGATLSEFINASRYLTNEGSHDVYLCLRGIRTYEQIDSAMRFTADLGSILELRKKPV
jgi:3-deoxy-7-phosphoheptulonate synthase/chorismate mutase